MKRSLDQVIQEASETIQTDTEAEAVLLILQEIVDQARDAKGAARNRALAQMAVWIETYPDLMVVASMSVIAGALVEFGGQADIAFPAIWKRIVSILPGIISFVGICRSEGAFEEDDPRAILVKVAERMPQQALQWQALNSMYLGAISMMARSVDNRQKARKDRDVIRALEGVSPIHEGANWLYRMLASLDQEEVIVIHPAQKKAFRVVLNGIASLGQLEILLGDCLIDAEREDRLDGIESAPSVVKLMQGQTQEKALAAIGVFEMGSYRALKADGQLDADLLFNVNELPAAFLPFQGRRVILLKDSSQQRVLKAQSPFDSMAASCQLVQVLNENETESYLKNILEVNAGTHD